jgi:hypothetical protein
LIAPIGGPGEQVKPGAQAALAHRLASLTMSRDKQSNVSPMFSSWPMRQLEQSRLRAPEEQKIAYAKSMYYEIQPEIIASLSFLFAVKSGQGIIKY